MGQLFPTDETEKSQFRCLVRAVFSIYNLWAISDLWSILILILSEMDFFDIKDIEINNTHTNEEFETDIICGPHNIKYVLF